MSCDRFYIGIDEIKKVLKIGTTQKSVYSRLSAIRKPNNVPISLPNLKIYRVVDFEGPSCQRTGYAQADYLENLMHCFLDNSDSDLLATKKVDNSIDYYYYATNDIEELLILVDKYIKKSLQLYNPTFADYLENPNLPHPKAYVRIIETEDVYPYSW